MDHPAAHFSAAAPRRPDGHASVTPQAARPRPERVDHPHWPSTRDACQPTPRARRRPSSAGKYTVACSGYCARQVELDCHFESIYESCTFFVITIEVRGETALHPYPGVSTSPAARSAGHTGLQHMDGLDTSTVRNGVRARGDVQDLGVARTFHTSPPNRGGGSPSPHTGILLAAGVYRCLLQAEGDVPVDQGGQVPVAGEHGHLVWMDVGEPGVPAEADPQARSSPSRPDEAVTSRHPRARHRQLSSTLEPLFYKIATSSRTSDKGSLPFAWVDCASHSKAVPPVTGEPSLARSCA